MTKQVVWEVGCWWISSENFQLIGSGQLAVHLGSTPIWDQNVLGKIPSSTSKLIWFLSHLSKVVIWRDVRRTLKLLFDIYASLFSWKIRVWIARSGFFMYIFIYSYIYMICLLRGIVFFYYKDGISYWPVALSVTPILLE